MERVEEEVADDVSDEVIIDLIEEEASEELEEETRCERMEGVEFEAMHGNLMKNRTQDPALGQSFKMKSRSTPLC